MLLLPLQEGIAETPFLMALVVILFFVALILLSGLRILREYERGIVFRLGRALPNVKGPGIVYLIPIIDRMVKVDLREDYFEVPHQRCITRDNAPVDIDVIIYHKVVDPLDSVLKVANWRLAAVGIAQTTLRSVVGDINLDGVLAEREHINAVLQEKLDEVTERWGVKVTGVEIREILPPPTVLDAMIRQMEAERIRRATVAQADGKREASILVAEGEKRAMVTRAEAKRKAFTIRAEGSKQAAILRAEGFAQSLERIMNVARKIDEKTMTLQYLETLNRIGEGAAKKYVVPKEFFEMFKEVGEAFGSTVKSKKGG
ncbi:MAG: SPFH domain-containing protein [Candidatus Freyarchaeota archaeon]|nr:SPFH domain-containing protein [Candidatus Freyrarchaeum guaymaensis]